jgi:hypothetical protein
VYRIAVGELYNPNRRSYSETPLLRVVRGHPVELVLFYESPTEIEIADIGRGRAKFAWVTSDHVAVLGFRFGGQRWSDVPYSPHLEDLGSQRAGIEPGQANTPVHVVLVDAATGVVRAQRLLTWPQQFGDAVRTAVDRLLDTPFSRQAHDAGVSALYSRYPDTAKMVRERADVTCTGGTQEAAAGDGVDANPGSSQPPASDRSWQAEIIAKYVGGLVPGRTYGRPLPDDLAPWYCYVVDSGHSIAIVPQAFHGSNLTLPDLLVPAPVRAVTAAGWTMSDGYVVCDLPYDPDLGLIADGHEF